MLSEKDNRLPGLITLILLTTLLSFVVGIILPHLIPVAPSAPLHLILAIGTMPLIFAAMIYFVPVLTRSGSPEPKVLLNVYGGLLAGIILVFSLLLMFRLYMLAAVIALPAVFGLSIWMQKRAKQAFGSPHPGLLWYRLALLLLGLALIVIILGSFWPQQWLAMRKLHLHLNLLGFVGLTALGTLRVLLPTVGGFQDQHAGPWLMREWRPTMAGMILIAIGAAWHLAMAVAGLILLLIPLLRLVFNMLWQQRSSLWKIHGSAPSLAIAISGLVISLLLGAIHGAGWLQTTHMSEIFILMFLMPLVTGAATHLLPLWLWPGPQAEQQATSRNKLGQLAIIRASMFIISGLMLLLEIPFAWLPASIGMAQFIFHAMNQTIQAKAS